jgi:branched-chain amino acid transport system permease protein
MLVIAAAAVAGLWLLLRRTPFGRVVRAGVQNPDMVAALGISLAPYMASVVALAVGLAALAGVLLAPISGVHPAMGADSDGVLRRRRHRRAGLVLGCRLGSVIVGVVRGLTVYFFPPAAEASMYLLMLLVLLFSCAGWRRADPALRMKLELAAASPDWSARLLPFALLAGA